jgi:hypothetical protein
VRRLLSLNRTIVQARNSLRPGVHFETLCSGGNLVAAVFPRAVFDCFMCWPSNLLKFEQVTQQQMDQHKGKAALLKNLRWKERQRREALDVKIFVNFRSSKSEKIHLMDCRLAVQHFGVALTPTGHHTQDNSRENRVQRCRLSINRCLMLDSGALCGS